MNIPVIVSAVRTPIGSFLGDLSIIPATKLGAYVIKEAVIRANIRPEDISEVIMGCVYQAGLRQAPARQASIYAGLPYWVPCMTINKVCGSGLKSVMLAAQAIQTGDADIAAAGGFESMSNVPYYLKKIRTGQRMGHDKIYDGLLEDGLLDAYNENMHMGNGAELCSRELNISRKEQDEYAVNSYKKTLDAMKNGLFKEEIIPVKYRTTKEAIEIFEDEEPKKFNPDKGLKLKPAFENSGTVTAFNASKINDGASALIIMSEEKSKELQITPLARIISQLTYAQQPEWFTTAPAYAIQKILKKTGLTMNDIDLFEVNEAFSVVALATVKLTGLPTEKLNVNGGAVALGHPVGASGARILTTLIYALKQRKLKRGLATLCIGGGEASAVIIEIA